MNPKPTEAIDLAREAARNDVIAKSRNLALLRPWENSTDREVHCQDSIVNITLFAFGVGFDAGAAAARREVVVDGIMCKCGHEYHWHFERDKLPSGRMGCGHPVCECKIFQQLEKEKNGNR